MSHDQNNPEYNPLLMLAEAMAVGGSQAILNQEAREQRRAAGNGAFAEIARDLRDDTRRALESAGFEFLESPVAPYRDAVLQRVKLPDGWKVMPTGHSMWSKLLDAQGNERALLGYKGAFYDRWAQVQLNTRYSISQEIGEWPEEGPAPTSWRIIDRKTGKTLFETPFEVHPYEKDNELHAVMVAWLNERFPDWKNPNAYWEEV